MSISQIGTLLSMLSKVFLKEKMMSVIGYARVSTDEQHLDLQINALKNAHCDQIFKDEGISAVAAKRPGFENALAALTPKDTFVIWKMDRAFRSLKSALDILEELEHRRVNFLCLTEAIDTTNPMGRCMYQIRNVFAELERNMIRERTIAGMEAARQRGSIIGRPRKLNKEEIKAIQGLRQANPQIKLRDIALDYKVSQRTVSRALKQS